MNTNEPPHAVTVAENPHWYVGGRYLSGGGVLSWHMTVEAAYAAKEWWWNKGADRLVIRPVLKG